MGLGAAMDYVTEVGLENLHAYENELMAYALEQMAKVPDIHIYGPASRSGVIAFNLGKHHAYDVGSFLDQYGIAIRTGHHCAMPLMSFYGVPAMCRASIRNWRAARAPSCSIPTASRRLMPGLTQQPVNTLQSCDHTVDFFVVIVHRKRRAAHSRNTVERH